ncbi:protein kinase domain-containing protein [Haematococcus lacustris]|uniref:Protein kinase domain-containing protein n=1 Tax=Haematococcus lacustris TaxID=44745 RepID=A0A699YGI0_HAELA|nr:protein kinase domain-containing protein [Haematococcus lacustris]
MMCPCASTAAAAGLHGVRLQALGAALVLCGLVQQLGEHCRLDPRPWQQPTTCVGCDWVNPPALQCLQAPEVLRCPTKDTPDQFKSPDQLSCICTPTPTTQGQRCSVLPLVDVRPCSTPGAPHYQMGADAWAVGVFAYELVAGESPFKAEQMVDTARNIISVNIHYPAAMSEWARSFISACLKKHPGKYRRGPNGRARNNA